MLIKTKKSFIIFTIALMVVVFVLPVNNARALIAPSFETGVDYGVLGAAGKVTIVEFNGDGKNDFVVATSASVSVFINNGTPASPSTFPKSDLGIAGMALGVDIADLNGDGKNDLIGVTGAFDDNKFPVFFNNGADVFPPLGTQHSTVGYPMSVAIADLSGDGKNDFIVVNRGSCHEFSDARVSIFINNDTPAFATEVDYNTNCSPIAVAIADLNNDGKNDFVVTITSSDEVSVFINNGNGTFASKQDYGTGSSPWSIAIGDLNGDGYNDLAAANLNSDNVSVFINNGDGTFAGKQDYAAGDGSYSIAIGDLNGDGYNDLATSSYYDDFISILLNNGDGTFASKIDYNTGHSSSSIAIGDLNGDSKNDLVVGNSNVNLVSVFLSSPPPLCTPTSCDDGNSCTDDECDPAVGCSYTNDDTNTCDDNNLCTVNHVCSAGVCSRGMPLDCDEPNACTLDSCNPATGCTTHDLITCDDSNPCTDDDTPCNSVTGCIFTNNALGCDDGDVCTAVDECSGGSCVGTSPQTCDDGNSCTDDDCDRISGCVYRAASKACNPAYQKFDKDIKVVLSDAINLILSLVGSLTLLFAIGAVFLYFSSGSNPDLQTKAKKTLTYAILGLIVVLMSYALIMVISKMVV